MKKIILTSFAVLMLQAVSGSGSTDPFSVPNDIFFPQQWWFSNDGVQKVIVDFDDMHTISQSGTPGVDIGWVDAQSEISTRATNPVTVAVIDSGIDPSHPDLAGRIAQNGFDFLVNPLSANPGFLTDPLGHGTHVSGIIAAAAKNPAGGIQGLAPASVQVLPLRVLWDTSDKKGTTFAYLDPHPAPGGPQQKFEADFTADAVRYAQAHGASVINISLGWPKIADTANARQAFQDVIKGDATHPPVLIVAAAGNDRKDQPTFPCAYEGVLCVGAVSNTGAMSIYSNFGGMVDILAPGDGIISTFPLKDESATLRETGYEMLTGTSQATPMVAGTAAVLKSIYPTISTNEIEARLMVSAGKLPSADSTSSALYGLVNLKGAIDAQAQPVYLPDFKAVDEIPVDEDSLQASGQISVKNLWQDASGVQAQVLVGGQVIGSVQADTLASGDSLTIPWTYKFISLDDSSALNLTVNISDSSGASKSFSINATAVRDMSKIKSSQTFAVPGVTAADWVQQQQQNGILFSRIGAIDSYPKENGLPRYYQEFLAPGTGGCKLDIYDPSTTNLMTQIPIPGIGKIEQVIRIDLTGSGKKDWVVAGWDQDPQSAQPSYWEFYFLDSNLQPLYGSAAASEWQIFHSGGQSVMRNYAVPGSWIQGGGKLLPSFFANGMLPAKDNTSEQEIGYYNTTQHLYYWSPLPSAAGSSGPVQLELRALDNSTFRAQNTNINLINVLPASPADMTSGHIRILSAKGSDLSSPMFVWDVKSITDTSLPSATGWNELAASGTAYSALTTGPSDTTTFFSSTIGSRENLVWTDTNGNYQDETHFDFESAEDPIFGLIGAFDLPKLGRFWFVQSEFELVGYRQASSTGSAGIQTQSIDVQYESTFGTNFSSMLSPVVVGTNANPLAGVYMDSMLVRGSHVSVAVWDPTSNTILKPLRYSLEIPKGCLEMSPVQVTSDVGSFALPIICPQSNNTVQVQVVQPTASK